MHTTLLSYLLAIPRVCGFFLPPQAGLLFLFFTTLLKVTQLTPGLKQGSLMFAELHSDARVRPKLASEEFSGCGQLFHSTNTYFRTYSEPGPFLSLYDFKIHLLTHVLLTKTPAGRYYSCFTDGLSNLPIVPQQCRLFLRFDLMSIHCSCDGCTNAMFAYIPSINSYGECK